jgi:hypothetical protein
MIDPSFWVDEKLGTLCVGARLFFMGLISQADDEGRLNGHPALLRSLIFPYDHDITVNNVDEWLQQLSGRDLITRYEVDRQKYIFIDKFKKHQTINRPQPSKLPEPITEHSLNDHTQTNEFSSTVHAQYKGREEKGKEEEVKEKGREKDASPPSLPSPDSNPHKDRIHKLVNECQLKDYTLYDLDQIFAYIGMVDLEVIEAAIKKGQGKHINYTLKTLKGMVTDGITKKEHVHPTPQPGQAPSNVTPIGRKGGKPQIQIVPKEEKVMTDEEIRNTLRSIAKHLKRPEPTEEELERGINEYREQKLLEATSNG